MKVSLNWLKEFVNITLSPEDLAYRLTMSTVEVEEIIKFGELFKGVFVGQIAEIKKHPNADNLSVAKVSFGKKKIQIIFGTLTLQVGQKLPVVVAGSILPSGMKVEKRNLRGIESQGMIASNKELGLDDGNDEITFFDSSVKAGTPLAKALDLDDVILDLDVLSNRPDLFSHIGVAREVAAITGKNIKHPELKSPNENSKKTIDSLLEVEIKDRKLCPRYEARILENIKIEASPEWLKNRLLALGIRPVNNVVDVTNFVMMELGQPMHAYDFDTLSGKKKKIVVRTARSGEEITTLDDKKRRLAKDVLLITDNNKKPIGVAGIMGGKETEVSDKTKTIILEAANFNWVSIRKASRILGLRTEAVTRFEKNLDPEMTTHALDRAAILISDIARGQVVKGRIDVKFTKDHALQVEVPLEKVARLLGKNFSSEKILKALASLGIKAEIKNESLAVEVPSFRQDIKDGVDVIEEVARIIGYDNIPTTIPISLSIPPRKNIEREFNYFLKDTLRGLGLSEVYTYTFIGQELLQRFGDNAESYYGLKNPLKPEHTHLRQNLVYSLIETAAFNSKNLIEFGIFELSNVFKPSENKYPKEEKKLGLAHYSEDSFFGLKGVVEALARSLHINIDFSSHEAPGFVHPQRYAKIKYGNHEIGFIGETHPNLEKSFGLKNKLTVAELDFSLLLLNRKEPTYKPFSKFPPILLDLAIVIDERVAEAEIEKEIEKIKPNLLSKIELFDVYRGSQIETGEKSLAYHFYYQSDDKTLTEAEIMPLHEKLVKKIKEKFGAKLRA